MDDDADILRLAILLILERAGRPLTAEAIADELARLALEGQRLVFSSGRERTAV